MTRIGDKPRLWFYDLRCCKRVERKRDGEKEKEKERWRERDIKI